MKQKPIAQRMGDFMEGKGFYIVLFLCVTAIGISGYYLFSGLFQEKPLSLDEPTSQVAGQTPNVQVPPVIKEPEHTPPATEKTPPATGELDATGGANATVPSKPTIFTWPVHGTLARGFSLEVFAYDSTMEDWRTHSGVDIEAALGTEVLAVSDGRVSLLMDDPLMGTTIIIEHANGVESLYANLAKTPTVKEGDTVMVGAVIGAIGNTAIAEGTSPVHLHFEMMKDGKAVDPVSYFPEGT